jgi:hypothetical protein
MLEPEEGEEKERPRFPPPTREQVGKRALCLHALVIRSRFEYLFRLFPDQGAPELQGLPPRVQTLIDWMANQRLSPHLSAAEQAVFAKPLGKWEPQEVLDGSWRKESLGILLWALNQIDTLPPYDQEFPDDVHLEYLGWLRPISEFTSRVRLRPSQEIGAARDISGLWHWRSRTTQLQRERVKLPKAYDVKMIIRMAAEKAYEQAAIPRPVGGDFPAFGKAYARLREQEYSLATSIAVERHFALNWLCGYSEDWDQTPTDT